MSDLNTWCDGDLVTASMFNNFIMDEAIIITPKRKCDYCGVYSKDETSCPKCGAPINWEMK